MRVVVDSNVCIAGLIRTTGPPGLVVEAALRGRIEVVTSWELVTELTDALDRAKLARYELAADDVRTLLQALAHSLPTVEIDVGLRDPDDALVVEAAVAGRADTIVTGDRDLLDSAELRAWLEERAIRLVSPREFLDELER